MLILQVVGGVAVFPALVLAMYGYIMWDSRITLIGKIAGVWLVILGIADVVISGLLAYNFLQNAPHQFNSFVTTILGIVLTFCFSAMAAMIFALLSFIPGTMFWGVEVGE